MKSKLLPKKAKEMLKDGTSNKKPLTEKQKTYFRAVAHGWKPNKKEDGGPNLKPYGMAAQGLGMGLTTVGGMTNNPYLTDIGGGISAGASIGSMIPGIGTLVGAGVGAGVGGIKGIVDAQKIKKDNALKNQQLDYQNRMANFNPTLNNNIATFGYGGPQMLTRFQGNKHEDGGIPIGQNDEVESGETSMNMQPQQGYEQQMPQQSPADQVKSYIFSDKLKVPGTKTTFAFKSKSIENKRGDYKDGPAKAGIQRELVRLMDEQEIIRQTIDKTNKKMYGDQYNQDSVNPQQSMEGQEEGIYRGGGFMGIHESHKGWCTPLSNPHCTGRRRALALTLKKHHGFHKKELGGPIGKKFWAGGFDKYDENGQPILQDVGNSSYNYQNNQITQNPAYLNYQQAYRSPVNNNYPNAQFMDPYQTNPALATKDRLPDVYNPVGDLPYEQVKQYPTSEYVNSELDKRQNTSVPSFANTNFNAVNTDYKVPGTKYYDTPTTPKENNPDAYKFPWLGYGIQALPELHNLMANRNPDTVRYDRMRPGNVSYEKARQNSRDIANLTRSIQGSNIRNTSGSRGSYLSNQGAMSAAVQRGLGEQLGQSYENEQNQNVGINNQSKQFNAQTQKEEALMNEQLKMQSHTAQSVALQNLLGRLPETMTQDYMQMQRDKYILPRMMTDRYQYDEQGKLIKRKDASGNWVNVSFDTTPEDNKTTTTRRTDYRGYESPLWNNRRKYGLHTTSPHGYFSI